MGHGGSPTGGPQKILEFPELVCRTGAVEEAASGPRAPRRSLPLPYGRLPRSGTAVSPRTESPGIGGFSRGGSFGMRGTGDSRPEIRGVSSAGTGRPLFRRAGWNMVSSRTENLDFRGFDSSRFVILRGGIPRSQRRFPRNLDSEILSLRIGRTEVGHDMPYVRIMPATTSTTTTMRLLQILLVTAGNTCSRNTNHGATAHTGSCSQERGYIRRGEEWNVVEQSRAEHITDRAGGAG